jgi:hypothetical protein
MKHDPRLAAEQAHLEREDPDMWLFLAAARAVELNEHRALGDALRREVTHWRQKYLRQLSLQTTPAA